MVNLGNRDLVDVDIEHIRKQFIDGEYAISDHAIIEARKDGIVPRTVEKLWWAAINGEVIEEYIDRKRVLIYAELKEKSCRFILLLTTLFGKSRSSSLRMCRTADIGSSTKSEKNKRVKSRL